MAKIRIFFDEEFKQSVAEKCNAAKEKISDVLLTDEGRLDTEKIGNAVTDTFQKAEAGVKDSCRKFSEEYVKDGTLDKEKLGEAANRSYRKAGRALATGMTRLAEKLSGKFGINGDNSEIFDAEVVPGDANVVIAEEAEFVTENVTEAEVAADLQPEQEN